MDQGQLLQWNMGELISQGSCQGAKWGQKCSRVTVQGNYGFELVQDMRWFHASWANYLAPLDKTGRMDRGLLRLTSFLRPG